MTIALAVALLGTCTDEPDSTIVAIAKDGSERAIDPDERLNLVVILTDDQWASSLGEMPNVRRLLRTRGITFRNAFVTTSLCCPSRASILTGRYSRHTGVFANEGPNGGAQSFDDRSTIATWLQGSGYSTSMVGKYLNGYQSATVPPGWDDWRVVAGRRKDADEEGPIGSPYYDYVLNENGRLVQYGKTPADYFTTVIGARAAEFIGRAKAPFFSYIAPFSPHLPATPAPEDRARFADLPPYRPASFDEADLSDKPWPAGVPRVSKTFIQRMDAHWRNGLASLQATDRMVASIVDALRKRDQLQRTVIVFTSDNGYLLGEHRLAGKIWAYEPSIRVPMVIRVPWRKRALTEDRFALNVDLASTLAELAGVVPRLSQDGSSLVPILLRERVPWRREFLVEWLGPRNGPLRRFVAVRTERWKLIRYGDGTRELYDLERDPDELQNLAGQTAYRSVEDELTRRLTRLTSG